MVSRHPGSVSAGTTFQSRVALVGHGVQEVIRDHGALVLVLAHMLVRKAGVTEERTRFRILFILEGQMASMMASRIVKG